MDLNLVEKKNSKGDRESQDYGLNFLIYISNLIKMNLNKDLKELKE